MIHEIPFVIVLLARESESLVTNLFCLGRLLVSGLTDLDPRLSLIFLPCRLEREPGINVVDEQGSTVR